MTEKKLHLKAEKYILKNILELEYIHKEGTLNYVDTGVHTKLGVLLMHVWQEGYKEGLKDREPECDYCQERAQKIEELENDIEDLEDDLRIARTI